MNKDIKCGICGGSDVENNYSLREMYQIQCNNSKCKALYYRDYPKDGWVVHVIGPDDVADKQDEITALRDANDINRSLSKINKKENDPFVIAVAKNKNIHDI